MSAELCRDIAYEAVRRGARANVHELWALLEAVDYIHPRTIVDIGSGEPVWWAWWSLGARVVGVSPTGVERTAWSADLPSTVVDITGHPSDQVTVRRVRDQLAGACADVVVLAAVADEASARTQWGAYASMVRAGGLVLVHEIERTPGVRSFWRGLASDGRRELIGSIDPIGYGIVEIHGKDRASHA